MTPDGTPVTADPAALQAVLSCAAKACACFRMGVSRHGQDALLDASRRAVEAFPDGGSAGAVALALVLDAVEQVGDDAAFTAIVAGLTSETDGG